MKAARPDRSASSGPAGAGRPRRGSRGRRRAAGRGRPGSWMAGRGRQVDEERRVGDQARTRRGRAGARISPASSAAMPCTPERRQPSSPSRSRRAAPGAPHSVASAGSASGTTLSRSSVPVMRWQVSKRFTWPRSAEFSARSARVERRSLDRELEGLRGHRLHEVVGGAGAHGPHGGVHPVEGGDDHHLDVGVDPLRVGEQLEAVAAGHDDVGEEHVEPAFQEDRTAAGASSATSTA